MDMTKAVLSYVKEKYGTVGDCPFSEEKNSIVLRNTRSKKWYGIIIGKLSKRKLNINSDEICDILNLKCDPMLSFQFVDNKGVFPAYHMNKVHWISVLLDSSVDMETITFLIDVSYSMVDKKTR